MTPPPPEPPACLCPQSRIVAIGAQVRARLEKKVRGLDAYVERFRRLVGRLQSGVGDTLGEGEGCVEMCPPTPVPAYPVPSTHQA